MKNLITPPLKAEETPDISTCIRNWRIKKGQKQNTIAKVLGKSKTTICKIENNQQPITMQQIFVLANYYNISINELMQNPF